MAERIVVPVSDLIKLFHFNPHEPRNPHGEWVGTSPSDEAVDRAIHMKPLPREGRAWGIPVEFGGGFKTPEEHARDIAARRAEFAKEPAAPGQLVYLRDQNGKLHQGAYQHMTEDGKARVSIHEGTVEVDPSEVIIWHPGMKTKSAETPRLSTEHNPLGTHGLWGRKTDQLPAYIQNIAHAMIRDGHDESSAIALAVAAVKRWAAGGNHVTPEVRAAAGRALAEWEKLRAEHAGKSSGMNGTVDVYNNDSSTRVTIRAADLAKVGPKGYEHGWHFVGIPSSSGSTQGLTDKEAYDSVRSSAPLSSSEEDAVAKYGWKPGYTTVNPYLHHDGQVFDLNSMSYKPASPSQVSLAKSMIEGMDGAFSKATPLEHPIQVHRGSGNMDDMFGPVGSKVGKTFNAKAYTSTTTVPDAKVGYGLQYETKPGRIHITVPAGAKVIKGNDFEHEVVLPRNSTFNVLSDEQHPDGTRHINLELQA